MAAMDFFEHQAVAKRNTRLLVILFGLAVISLLALTALLVAAVTGGMHASQQTPGQAESFTLQWDIVIAAMGMTLSAISLAVLYKWSQLRGGGRIVAEALGGVRLSPDSRDPLERKILNVTEEMAIAANMPVPPVYLLKNEAGINAFAAGYSPRDAVIGITRGCAENLTRDQLQGVVAHEIAHILNGDMRMNIRIMAILNGILFISHAGYLLLRTGMFSRRNDKNPLPFIGIGLLIIGAIGILFGNLIKAAVSRQREYLADASAVQFTRNPDGIGGALEQIGALQKSGAGSRVESKNADEAAHLFFGQAVNKMMSVFATHPPLSKRIKRVRPSWDGTFRANSAQQLKKELQSEQAETSKSKDDAKQDKRKKAVLNTILTGAVLGAGESGGRVAGSAIPVSAALRDEVRQQQGAEAIIFAIALSADAAVREKQMALIREQHGDEMATRTLNDYAQVQDLPLEERLPLVELSIPALKTFAEQDARAILATLHDVLAADEQITLYDWCLGQIVRRYVLAQFAPNKRVPLVQTRFVSDAEYSLSVLAHYGHPNSKQDSDAAFHAGARHFQKKLAPFSHTKFSFGDLADVLDRINEWTPQNKERMVNAWLTCAEYDGEITVVERKLLTALSACIGEPIPESSLERSK
ncbi:M48 family metallopeptidase [Aliidiomarina halalkaliphila]|uniref:M48 family metallopeptidase n=1 Tax=Aliidiomarina halalkaliphila TaxID=2593535 RepID=A0A552X062_9GAMM|nr:M48 family metallopeptidase [Aliidiomarina halalkaliphila]TRW48447.1 M48 family metallopeptidase [Aliidiomarina halalkaliphila]